MAKKKVTPEAAEANPETEIKYSKTALVLSRRFEGARDLLAVLLADGGRYTIAEAEAMLNNYLNKEV